MKVIKLEALFLALILTSSLAWSGEGGAGPGGGSGVVLPNGEVFFVDTLSKQTLDFATHSALSYSQVTSKIYKKQRYVSRLAKIDNNFFDCASEKLKALNSKYSVLDIFLPSLKSVEVLQVNFQIPSAPDSKEFRALNLKFPVIASFSNSLPNEKQVAIAAFANSQVWVSNPLYRRLSTNDKCALGVHEALRQMNYGGYLKVDLEQSEIEVATRYFMGISGFDSEDVLNRVRNKLSNRSMTSDEYFEKAKYYQKVAKDYLALLLSLGSKPSDLTEAEEWEIRSKEYMEQINYASARNSKLTAMSVMSGVAEIKGMVMTGLVERALVTKGLTSQREDEQLWDVLNLNPEF